MCLLRAFRALVFVQLVFTTPLQLFAGEPIRGVLVETITRGGGAASSGIREGDILISWSSANGTRKGVLESPFSMQALEAEEAPFGTILQLRRGDQYLEIKTPQQDWGLQTRPLFSSDNEHIYKEGIRMLDAGESSSAIRVLDELSNSISKDNPEAYAWVQSVLCEKLVRMNQPGEAISRIGTVLQSDKSRTDTTIKALILQRLSQVLQKEGFLEHAISLYQPVIAPDNPGETLLDAFLIDHYGSLLVDLEKYDESQKYFEHSLSIRQKKAEGTLIVSKSINNLAEIEFSIGNLDQAERGFREALIVREKLAPGSFEHASSLNNIGTVKFMRGNLAEAEQFYMESFSIRERLDPEGIAFANSNLNLGAVAFSKGKPEKSEEYYRTALRIFRDQAPDSLLEADVLINLGQVARERRDIPRAQDYYRHALQIEEQRAPGSTRVADSLNNLGNLAYDLQNYEESNSYFGRALEILEKSGTEDLFLADILNNIGTVACDTENYAKAQSNLNRALEIRERLAPGSLDVAISHNNLGYLSEKQGALDAALVHYKQALLIRDTLAPGSFPHAESLHELGNIYWKLGKQIEGMNHLKSAVDVLEQQTSVLGGTREVRSGFSAKFHSYYRDYIDVLEHTSKIEEAFQVLEQSRARQMLSMMAERNVEAAGIPAELLRKQQDIDTAYDAAQSELSELNLSQAPNKIEQLRSTLRKLREEQHRLEAEFRRSMPQYASIQYPRPLTFTEAQKILDPETILLSYSVGKERTLLFVIEPGADLIVHSIAAGEKDLKQKVEEFRKLIRSGATDTQAGSLIGIRGAALYDLLVRPADEAIGRNRFVLLSPDGPLHLLPFSALRRDLNLPQEQYFGSWKPSSYVLSATVFAELRKRRNTNDRFERTLVAFGNPIYAGAEESTLSEGNERGRNLVPLPSTGDEVFALQELFGKNATIVYAGAEATEEHARDSGGVARYLHFACHGLLDRNVPLNSSLALSAPTVLEPGHLNGFLQAWEVLERMQVHSDLVVLSACDTGIGKDMGGEGLMGLNTAFLGAGASSVVASLWSIADQTTAVFMTQFYTALKQGKSKSSSLQAAQIYMMENRITIPDNKGNPMLFDASSPFFWAAFQLNGDWL